MSRFNDWTSAHRGLGNFAGKHLELDYRGPGRPNKFYGVEMSKLINDFSKVNKIKGSFSTRVLKISQHHYKGWTEFIIARSKPDMYDLQEQDLKNIAEMGVSNNG